uniref:Plasma membrane calcium transporting P-type ATPase C-terminal domain-containing protein n=1 Tax=Panagrolaimus sp. PS1159 TaxID=55785 RepID=A0AC35G5A6_9BILA
MFLFIIIIKAQPFLHAATYIRVVKAFQSGLDRREPSLTGPSAARLREISRQLKLQVEQEGKGIRSRSHSRQNEAVSSL